MKLIPIAGSAVVPYCTGLLQIGLTFNREAIAQIFLGNVNFKLFFLLYFVKKCKGKLILIFSVNKS